MDRECEKFESTINKIGSTKVISIHVYLFFSWIEPHETIVKANKWKIKHEHLNDLRIFPHKITR